MSFEQQVNELKKQHAGLFDGDGKPIHTSVHHHEREREIAQQAGELFEQHDAALVEKLDAVKAELDELAAPPARDPIASLSPKELERAAALKTFLEEDTLTLPMGELAGRVEQAKQENDKAALYIYLRALPKRAENAPQGLRHQIPISQLERDIKTFLTPATDTGNRVAALRRQLKNIAAQRRAARDALAGLPGANQTAKIRF